MRSRAERRQAREGLKSVLIRKYLDAVEKDWCFASALEQIEEGLEKQKKKDTRNKMMYNAAWIEAEKEIMAIALALSSEKNTEARERKMKRIRRLYGNSD